MQDQLIRRSVNKYITSTLGVDPISKQTCSQHTNGEAEVIVD